MRVTKFKQQDEEERRLQQEYSKLAEVMPQCAVENLGEDEMSHMQKRFAALTNLTSTHSGELVEADLTRHYWRLVDVATGFNDWMFCWQNAP